MSVNLWSFILTWTGNWVEYGVLNGLPYWFWIVMFKWLFLNSFPGPQTLTLKLSCDTA